VQGNYSESWVAVPADYEGRDFNEPWVLKGE
jgi:hypothetical protein